MLRRFNSAARASSAVISCFACPEQPAATATRIQEAALVTARCMSLSFAGDCRLAGWLNRQLRYGIQDATNSLCLLFVFYHDLEAFQGGPVVCQGLPQRPGKI